MGGGTGGFVACLEDDIDTIDPQIRIIKSRNLEPKIFERPYDLGNWIDETPANQIKAFVLDMHMKKILDLREINLPDVDTVGGEAVGLALAEQFLGKTHSDKFGDTPVAFLTGFPVQARVQSRIKDFARTRSPGGQISRNSSVQLLEKRDTPSNLAKFDGFLDLIAPAKAKIRAKTTAVDNSSTAISPLGDRPQFNLGPKYLDMDRERYDELVAIGFAIAQDLKFSPTEHADLFGWQIDTEEAWDEVREMIECQINNDVRDRMGWLIELKAVLEAVFGEENIEAQRRWLATKFDVLDGRSAKEILHGGGQHDFVRLVSIARRMTG